MLRVRRKILYKIACFAIKNPRMRIVLKFVLDIVCGEIV